MLNKTASSPKKPDEVPSPGKNPETIPIPEPEPNVWPKREPEIQPAREPLTIPSTAPPEIPPPPQNAQPFNTRLNWSLDIKQNKQFT